MKVGGTVIRKVTKIHPSLHPNRREEEIPYYVISYPDQWGVARPFHPGIHPALPTLGYNYTQPFHSRIHPAFPFWDTPSPSSLGYNLPFPHIIPD